jgi:DNA adenine methylase
MTADKVQHPLIRYHGSKWRIAPWIIEHFPWHRIYVEPFGGGASVLLRKSRAAVEVYNDIDGEICNLFRTVRDNGEGLANLLYFTPYSRDEFIKSFEPSDDPIEQARRTIIRSYQGFGSGYVTNTVGSKCARPEYGFCIGWRVKGNLPHVVWNGVPESVVKIMQRLRGVILENNDYRDVIIRNDTDETLVYADPPYVSSTRDRGKDYRFEFSEADHVELAKLLHETAGPAIVSGYHSELYKDLYHDWRFAEKKSRTAGNTERTEVIWIKKRKERGLFDE